MPIRVCDQFIDTFRCILGIYCLEFWFCLRFSRPVWYLKQIFHRTGTKRLAELTRRANHRYHFAHPGPQEGRIMIVWS